MRLKAKIPDPSAVQTFAKMVYTVSKINKEGVIRMTKNRTHFIVYAKDIADGSVKVWSEINNKSLYGDMILESKHPDNEILFKINFDTLYRALRSAQQCNSLTMRLSKRQKQPYLQLHIEKNTKNNIPRIILQEIPCQTLHQSHTAEYIEPNLPEPEINICLPSLKILRNITDRMKVLSNNIVIEANNSGELRLLIETDNVSVKSVIRGLDTPTFTAEHEPEVVKDPSEFGSGRIDIKRFSQFLHAQNLVPTNTICCIVENKAIIFYIENDEVSATYYIPVIY